jgi:hypothetical protein
LVSEPPPAPIAKTTFTFGTGLPKASFTSTVGTDVTADPTTALTLSPDDFVTALGGPAAAVALNATAVRVPLDAVRTFAPVAVPRIHDPTVAIPSAPVVTEPPVTLPPPDETVNVTMVPLIGEPR